MTSSALLLAVTGWKPDAWYNRFRALDPKRDLRVWPDTVGDPASIRYACAWKPPAGLLASLPNLEFIFSLGAGVDHLLGDPTLPDLPVVRIVDPDLTMRMTEYVVQHVLNSHRRQHVYDAQQRARIWKAQDQPPANEVTVGIMGLGVLGRDAAEVLRRIGFQVVAWTRNRRDEDGIETFHGAAGLGPFLARTEILVCLLPHTPETDGILNLDLFRQLRRDGPLGGAYVINAGRGRLQVDADILAALEEGSLTRAVLDVFPVEPLPAESPLWNHPGVTVTPHNAAASEPKALAAYVLDQIARIERGLPPENVIDRKLGY